MAHAEPNAGTPQADAGPARGTAIGHHGVASAVRDWFRGSPAILLTGRRAAAGGQVASLMAQRYGIGLLSQPLREEWQ
jgi:hypothetical protein